MQGVFISDYLRSHMSIATVKYDHMAVDVENIVSVNMMNYSGGRYISRADGRQNCKRS